MERARRRAVAARRSHRPGRRRVRPRARVRRPLLARIVRDFPALQDRAGAHHDARGRRVRPRGADERRPRRSRRSTCCWSRNALFAGGIRPHYYCLPVLKRETHREALVAAATSGNPRFFLGTDSRAARAAHEGERVRLRRLLLGPRGARALRGGVRGRRTRSTGSKASRAASARTSTACRATRTRITLERDAVDASRPSIRSARDTIVPLRAGEPLRWRVAAPAQP